MIIKFKKIHTISDKVYISFDDGKTYTAFEVHNNNLIYNKNTKNEVLFGKPDTAGDKIGQVLIDFIKDSPVEANSNASPESLDQIKIFGKNKDEIWIPHFSKQRLLAYENETDKSIYVDVRKHFNDFISEVRNASVTSEDYKLYNISNVEELTTHLILSQTILNGASKKLKLGSGILPSKVSYNNAFENIELIKEGFELPDNTTSADYMYRGCTSLEKPISFLGNIKRARGIFKGTKVRSLPKHWGNSIEDIAEMFENTPLTGTFSDAVLPDSIKNMEQTFAGTNISYAPAIPKNVSNLKEAFRGSTIKSLPIFNNTEVPNVNLNSTFSECTLLGADGIDIGPLNIHVKNLDRTFSICSSLSQFYKELPSSVESAVATFQNCPNLIEGPDFNEGIRDISSIFQGCHKLINPRSDDSVYIIPSSVVTMPESFAETNISETPDMSQALNLRNIDNAFANCPNLKIVRDINTDAPLESVISAFSLGHVSLTQFPSFPKACTDDLSRVFKPYDEKSLNKEDTLLSVGDVYEHVTNVESMFEGASNLTRVGTINLGKLKRPASLNKMFKGCSSLEEAPSIFVSGNPTAEEIFKNCTSLSLVRNFPVVSSYKSAFENCRSLMGKGLHEYAESYSESTRQPLPTFPTVTGPVVVTDMYKDCINLREVSFPSKATGIENVTGNGVLGNVSIVNNIPNNITDGNKLLKFFPNVEIIKSVPTTLNIDGWFKGLSSLKSCGFDEDVSITSMESAFENDSSLVNTKFFPNICEKIANSVDDGLGIFIPKHVQNIKKAFRNCSSISYIDEIPASVQYAENSFELSTYNATEFKIGSIKASGNNFTDAFKNRNLTTISEIGTETSSVPRLGNSGLKGTLTSVGQVHSPDASYLFNFADGTPTSVLSEIKLSPNTTSLDHAFVNCTNLRQISFGDSSRVPSSVENLNSAFKNSGIEIKNEDFFDDDFTLHCNSGEDNEGNRESNFNYQTFYGCPNVEVMPKLKNYVGNPLYLSQTFAECPNLKSVSLITGVQYDETFKGSVNIERCELVPLGIKDYIYANTFEGCSKLKTIGLLEQNFGYSKTAFDWEQQAGESLIVDGKSETSVLTGVDEGTNECEFTLYATTAKGIEDQISEAQKKGTVTLIDEQPISDKYTIDEEAESFTFIYHQRIKLTFATHTKLTSTLEKVLNKWYDEGLIKSTSYITQKDIISMVSSYWSTISNYFPNLEVVEQLGAQNCSGILATGQVFEVGIDGVLINKNSEFKIGPIGLKEVPGIEKVEGGPKWIANDNVSSLSHAFYGAKNLEKVGSIPSNVTSITQPFSGCENLEEVGHIYANADDYEAVCFDLPKLKSVGDLGTKGGVHSNLDSAFEDCVSLQSVGKIDSSFHSFRSTFSNCQSLKSIGALYYKSLNDAITKVSTYGYSYQSGEIDLTNIIGMFYKAARGITIYTDNVSKTKQFFINNCFILRNKVEPTGNGAYGYTYEYDDETQEDIFSYEACLSWANSLRFEQLETN